MPSHYNKGGTETNPEQARIDAELAVKDQDFLRKLNQNLEFLIGQLGESNLSDLIGTGNVNPNQQLLDMLQSNPAENLFGVGNLGQTAGGPYTVNLGGSPFEIDPLGSQLFNAGLLLKQLGKKENREGIMALYNWMAGRNPMEEAFLKSLPGPAKRPQLSTPDTRGT